MKICDAASKWYPVPLTCGAFNEGDALAVIRAADPADDPQMALLLRDAFGQPSELDLVYALREAGAVAFELVAEVEGAIQGHICFSRMVAPDGWLALAPLAVRPPSQGQGVGGALVRAGLEMAGQKRFPAVVVLGERGYYGRFGFLFPQNREAELHSPYPGEYIGLFPLDRASTLSSATLVYPEPFNAV